MLYACMYVRSCGMCMCRCAHACMYRLSPLDSDASSKSYLGLGERSMIMVS